MQPPKSMTLHSAAAAGASHAWHNTALCRTDQLPTAPPSQPQHQPWAAVKTARPSACTTCLWMYLQKDLGRKMRVPVGTAARSSERPHTLLHLPTWAALALLH